MVKILLMKNGKRTTPFRFTEAEADRLLFRSSKKNTYVFLNPMTMRRTRARGRL